MEAFFEFLELMMSIAGVVAWIRFSWWVAGDFGKTVTEFMNRRKKKGDFDEKS